MPATHQRAEKGKDGKLIVRTGRHVYHRYREIVVGGRKRGYRGDEMSRSLPASEIEELVRDLHSALLEINSFMTRPEKEIEDGSPVNLDRVLFPLLLGIERYGPIGVVDLGARVGRDYTTVSRHIARLESLGLIERQPGKLDRRLNEAVVTQAGKALIDRAEDRKIAVELFEKWQLNDLENLVRLLRKLNSTVVNQSDEP